MREQRPGWPPVVKGHRKSDFQDRTEPYSHVQPTDVGKAIENHSQFYNTWVV